YIHEVRGPPAAKAFDSEGNPTKAAEGFCRRNFVPVDSLYRNFEGKTEYVYVRVMESAQLALEVNSLFDAVDTGKDYGVFDWCSTVTVDNAESYAGVMQQAGISVDTEQRKKMIIERSNDLAKGVDGCLVMQSSLLNEVMQKHQKYFALTDDKGNLLPYFIAVANGAINETVVSKGNEAVLRARYEDAKFFYELDTSKKFSEFRSQLNGILFHEKLGTMEDKMIRVESTVSEIGLALGISEDKLQITREAASLAMSDLSTAVVTEFTSLSGIMARHYALREGYSQQVSDALFEIILPRFSGDILPETDAGTVLSIADSLVGLFGAGCQPSSTNDPFGLRRISYGLVQVMVEKDRNLDLRHALEVAASAQSLKIDAGTIDEVQQFVTRRLEQFLVDKGINPEVVRAILLERADFPGLAAKSAYKEDEKIRNNRLALLREISELPRGIADLSVLPGF
nr:glycine--tRNA ligase, chloroplastic/mitochondrial 2 isoform X2 [Tanacetum cinerariifolium]